MTTATATPHLDVEALTGRTRAVHTRTAVLGFVLAAAGLGFLTGALALHEPEVLAEVGPILVVVVVIGALAWRFGTWAKALAAVVGLALLGMFGPFLTASLAFPESFFDFVPAAFMIGGLALGAGGSIAAVVRRRQQEVGATALERRIRTWAVVVAAGLLAVSGVMTVAARAGEAVAAPAGSVAVATTAGQFTDGPYTVEAGTVTFAVRNDDPFIHTFTIPALGIDTVLQPGKTAVIEAGVPAGTYTLYCKPHANMDDPDPETAGMATRLTAR